MRIIWHGHSCFEIDDGNTTLVTDPHDGRSLGIRPLSVSADFVLVTHRHADHSAVGAVRGDHEDIVCREGQFRCGSFEAEGFPGYHDCENGVKHGSNMIYQIRSDGMRICHCGDIGAMPPAATIGRIKRCDVLMIPVGEVCTMDISEVTALIDLVDPKVVIPMHYHVSGLTMPLRTLERFTDAVNGGISKVGKEMDISKDEFPASREYWKFSR